MPMFKALHQVGVVEEEFSLRLVEMAKFRNRLVHAYWDLDNEAVYRILQDCTDDFQLFQEETVAFFNKRLPR
jgi:uncharacterized protein YutE (UPF0331/DUF86 family)